MATNDFVAFITLFSARPNHTLSPFFFFSSSYPDLIASTTLFSNSIVLNVVVLNAVWITFK